MLIIAYLSMFIDHIFKFGVPEGYGTNPIFGRIAMPIFIYLLTVGLKRTKSKTKYFARLLIFALVSQIPYTLMILKLSDIGIVERNVIYRKCYSSI